MIVPSINWLSLPLILYCAQTVLAKQPSITQQQARGDISADEKAEFFLQRHNATLILARSSENPSWSGLNPLAKRIVPGAGALLCSKDAPCVDDSCCSVDGICGYGPDYCGSGCTSHCDAKAMCGKYADAGNQKCGMNICCSWSGWCGTSHDHCIGPDATTACQQGMGACEMISQPRCGGGSALGRTVGYYQASNVRNRVCNQISPAQIDVEGYTHLNFAFASIDPATFQVTPATPDDIPLYTQFTARKSSTLQTWIAVGGFDFSDPGSTHTTWSDLCASAGNRQAFISSMISFMDKYGFTGVDIDWEYPVDSTRGGTPADKENFVALVREMSAAFNGKYGISLTLAPDYWYLRWFDAKAMEPYVTFFGFMAYDLHGAFDNAVKTLAPTVRGQADIREIGNDTMPLWYAGLNPEKINFGLAWYGRGYTLTDPSCRTFGCGWSGPSKAGKCTATPGVMSLIEIQDKIDELKIKPTLNSEALMKELVFDDQWIGYDDEETVALKKEWASGLCFGGTMAWSVDFHSGKGDSDSPPISSDGSCGLSSKSKATCKGSTFGDCCSSSGWCGSDDGHCASGCQSTYGTCTLGGVTTDGTCGAGHNDFTCGDWPAGHCCSSSGYCGSGASFCGKGCQNGCLDGGTCSFGTCGGNPDENNPYKNYDCKNKAVTDITMNPKDRWDALHVKEAWDDAVKNWQLVDKSNSNLGFVESVSHFLGGPPGMACGTMADRNGCNAFIQDCSSVDTPAGYLILNSLIAIQGVNWNFWDGVTRTQADLQGAITKLTDTFAPVPKDSMYLKLMIDMFGLVFAMSAAPFWNSGIKKFAYWEKNKNTHGTTKDAINGFVSNGVSIAKDALNADGNPDPGKVLSDNLGSMIHGLRDGTDRLNSDMFSGSDSSIDILTALIKDGQTIPDGWKPASDPDIMLVIERAFFMTFIPQAWQLGQAGSSFAPVVLYSGHECRETRTDGPPFDEEYDVIDSEALKTTGVCFEGSQYFLVSMAGEFQECSGGGDPLGGGSVGCEDNYMYALPGSDELTGNTSKWGGLSRDDFVISSILSYRANGNKNGWALADPSQNNFYSGYDWDEHDMQRPGLSNIPTCPVEEARDNWINYNAGDHKFPTKNYPCN